jgi:UDP-N-acetylmuramate--alanine ligase
VIVVDDYAHHPTEIRATLSAARDRYPEHELWVVWQPHTYSRTIVYFNDFIGSFQRADHVIVTSTYAAREVVRSSEIEEELVREMSHSDVRFISEMDQVLAYLSEHLHKDSVVMILSAGDAHQLGSRLLEDLSTKANTLDV